MIIFLQINGCNFLNITIIIRCIFEKDGKYYPEAYLDECLYDV